MSTRKKRSVKAQLKSSSTPIEMGSDVKALTGGYCVIDETDGKTYRITTVNGILNTTEVI